MEQQEKPVNEEEKQNPEEEEFDEDDEEEKEESKNKQEKVESKKDSEKNNEEQNKEINTTKEDNQDKNKNDKEIVKEENQNKEENQIQEKLENNPISQTQEKNDKDNNNNNNISKEDEEQEESSSSYILKYVRKSNEPKESAYDKELIKSKKCLYMIEFKIIKGKSEKYLLVYCHEIAAIYFDEIYEKKYSIKDLYKENRHFRIFDEVDEAKNIIDEILNNNATNAKKIFIECQYNIIKLHLKIYFFVK